MRPSIAAAGAAMLAACLALCACGGSDKAQVHQAGADLTAAGKETASAAKHLVSAAAHDLKSAGDKASIEAHGATANHPEKTRNSTDSDH